MSLLRHGFVCGCCWRWLAGGCSRLVFTQCSPGRSRAWEEENGRTQTLGVGDMSRSDVRENGDEMSGNDVRKDVKRMR